MSTLPRSHTPVPNTTSSNTLPATERTTSRTESHEHILSVPLLKQQSSRPHFHSHSLVHCRDLQPSTSGQHMARNLPTDSQLDDAHSSYSSDSTHEEDIADAEREDKEEPQTAAGPLPPPKKKRTRTLTTPHQSAVLHALLAQSRFPSTAVREEVGRSIGLSARKVQIWFQNQRQKARRPHGLTDLSKKRTPQYGSFPPGFPDTSVAGPSMANHRAASDMTYRHQYGGMTSDQSSFSGYHSDSPAQLSGPGIPGWDRQHESSNVSRPNTAPMRPHEDPRSSPHHSRPSFNHHPATDDYYQQRPATTATSYAGGYDREARTLPPLIPPPRRESSPPTSTRAGIPLLSLTSPRNPSPEVPSERPSQRLVLPSYTLQPLQRETMPLTLRLRSPSPRPYLLLRPESAPSSASPTNRTFITSPSDPGTSAGGGDTSPRPVGRYDPVRGTFIPTPTASEGQNSRSCSPSREAHDRI